MLKGNTSINHLEGKKTYKSFIFNSSKEGKKKYVKAKVGVTRIPGLAYGVGKSLIEEGIFSIQAVPMGPNLCLLTESVEGDLDLILNEEGK